MSQGNLITQLPLSRREMLRRMTVGFGQIALAGTLAEQAAATDSDLLSPSPSHFAPKARRVVMLFLNGGPSHIDLWDWKPVLARRSGEPMPFDLPENDMTFGVKGARLLGPISKYRPRGQSGIRLSDLMPELHACADELCFLNGMHADNSAHQPARRQVFTGVTLLGKPSFGSWVSYGLGTENRNLPSFVALRGAKFERASAFLPAAHHGIALSTGSRPIKHLVDSSMSKPEKRAQLDFIQSLNRAASVQTQDREMEGMIRSMELAFRMQVDAANLADLSGETEATKRLYGLEDSATKTAGRQCILTRRCLEAGIRFLSVTLSSWDHHGDILKNHPTSCRSVDRPIAALIKDLKSRGLLEDTLIVCLGEFGRTPYWQDDPRIGRMPGREHNRYGFSAWLAGGGIKPGFVHGATDEFGGTAVDGKVHMHDLHATILHQLGLDHEKLTYRHAGRNFRLTDVYGEVVHEILG